MLDPRVTQEIRDLHARLDGEGKLPTREQLRTYHATFRDRFGPEHLAGLDGDALLETMHGRSGRNSLMYWLEFKDDEEFPATIFGSIGGGSALKFGFYRRSDTGAWTTGSPQQQREMDHAEAVQRARTQRDELLRGCELLSRFPVGADAAACRILQEQLMGAAPEVSASAWGHKYFFLTYPDRLEGIHNADYQRFHLIRLLQVPPAGEGRYLCAGRYARLALELDWPISVLTTVLARRNGAPVQFWRVLTRYNEPYRNGWPDMLAGNYVGIGWKKIGDLSGTTPDSAGQQRVADAIREHYPGSLRIPHQARDVHRLVARMQVGDIVVGGSGGTMQGVGRVAGEYVYQPGSEFPHRRPVEWLNVGDWPLPDQDDGKRYTVGELSNPQNLIEIERRLLDRNATRDPGPHPAAAAEAARSAGRHPVPSLAGVAGDVQAVLERKSQVIIYGPPGTGKTFWAERSARDLAAYAAFGQSFAELGEAERTAVLGVNGPGGLVRLCSFHPNYGYEDFLEGYRPETAGDQMLFVLRDGIFKRLCADALANPERDFYLIVDEINRGDIPRIFGELLTVLEKSKRGRTIILPVSGQIFLVPENVYLIGTMNTADRSIALLDTALRRRFGFVELMPDTSLLAGTSLEGIPLGAWLDALNGRIREHVGRDARNLQIGHSYFLEDGRPVGDFARFARIVREDILPLLEEYCYEDYAVLEKVVGDGLLDRTRQTFKFDLFEPANRDELRRALLAPCPDVVATPLAVGADAEPALDEDDAEGDEAQPSDAAAGG